MRGAFQVVASWLFTFAFGVSACSITVVTLGLFSRWLTPWLLNFWGRTMLRIAGVTLELEGGHYLTADTMKVATFNHGSVLDAFLVTAIMPAGSVAALKREALYYPIVGVTVWMLGFLLIDRGDSSRAQRTMARASRRMARERLTVFIAPEGTRGKTGELLPFKKGALRLALESGAPIVPVLIDGAFTLHPPGRTITTPGIVRIRVLPPRPSSAFTSATLGDEAQTLRMFYVVELARLHADRFGEPPAAPRPAAANG